MAAPVRAVVQPPASSKRQKAFERRAFVAWSWQGEGRSRKLLAHHKFEVVAVLNSMDMECGERLKLTEHWLTDRSCKTRQTGMVSVSTGLGASQTANAGELFAWQCEEVGPYRCELDKAFFKGNPSFINKIKPEALASLPGVRCSASFLRVPLGYKAALAACSGVGMFLFPMQYCLMAGFPRPAASRSTSSTAATSAPIQDGDAPTAVAHMPAADGDDCGNEGGQAVGGAVRPRTLFPVHQVERGLKTRCRHGIADHYHNRHHRHRRRRHQYLIIVGISFIILSIIAASLPS